VDGQIFRSFAVISFSLSTVVYPRITVNSASVHNSVQIFQHPFIFSYNQRLFKYELIMKSKSKESKALSFFNYGVFFLSCPMQVELHNCSDNVLLCLRA